MNASISTEANWYTRREGIVRGPFAAEQVSRHILLGRIRMSDELRRDTDDWRPAAQCEELIPEELRLPLTEENQARLQQARMEADERTPGDRRARNPDPPAEIRERRSGVERRRPEPVEVVRFRALRHGDAASVTPALASSPARSGGRWVVGLLVLAVLWWWIY